MAKKTIKMVRCKSCGQQMNAGTKFCPNCGAKNKKPIYKKWWFWLIIAFVVFATIGGGSDGEKFESTQVVSERKEQPNQNNDIESQQVVSQEEENEIVPEISETVIYEGNNCVITATGIKKNGGGWDINLLIENNSSLNLGFNAHAYAVNGISTKNNIYDMDCDVASGKKANTILHLRSSFFEEYGISDVKYVDVLFWAYDNDESFKEFDTGQIEIQTSLYDGSHDIVQGETIYDQEGIKVDYLGNDNDDYFYVITNSTGSYFNFDIDEVTVNDFTNTKTDYDLFNEVLLNNCQMIITINVDAEFKDLNSISEVETLEWNLAIRPYGEYSDEYKVGPMVYSVQ